MKKHLILFLIAIHFGLSAQTKINYTFTIQKNKNLATIYKNGKPILYLTKLQTMDLLDLVTAVQMHYYKSNAEMFEEFLSYIDYSSKNGRMILSEYQLDNTKKLDVHTQKILVAKAYVETNKLRRKYKKKDFMFSKKLYKVAQDYANYCVKNNWFSHYDMDGGSAVARIDKEIEESFCNPKCNPVENIYTYNSASPLIAVESWESSPGHFKNLMCAETRYVAVGISQYENGSFVYVQNFLTCPIKE